MSAAEELVEKAASVVKALQAQRAQLHDFEETVQQLAKLGEWVETLRNERNAFEEDLQAARREVEELEGKLDQAEERLDDLDKIADWALQAGARFADLPLHLDPRLYDVIRERALLRVTPDPPREVLQRALFAVRASELERKAEAEYVGRQIERFKKLEID